MKRYVKKVFFAPKSPGENGGMVASTYYNPPNKDNRNNWSGSVEGDLRISDCSNHVNLEFYIGNYNVHHPGDIEKARRKVAYKRKKMKKIIESITSFAEAYEQSLREYEKALDKIENRQKVLKRGQKAWTKRKKELEKAEQEKAAAECD